MPSRHLPGLARAGGRATPPAIAKLAVVEQEMARVERLGGRILVLGEPGYPELLAMLEDAPPAISILGDAGLLSRRAVGMVGARNASANGQRMAEALAADLASRNLLIVSGMARGIDTAAHNGALHTGTTAAAIAGGLDVAYRAGEQRPAGTSGRARRRDCRGPAWDRAAGAVTSPGAIGSSRDCRWVWWLSRRRGTLVA